MAKTVSSVEVHEAHPHGLTANPTPTNLERLAGCARRFSTATNEIKAVSGLNARL